MNKKAIWFIGGFALSCATYLLIASTTAEGDKPATKIGYVSFRNCLEGSKIGKHEQGRFEELKKKMESTIEGKEKELKEMEPKFKDEYMDTLTPEAEKQLKANYGKLSQELSEIQNQYYQMLNQANYQIVGKLSDLITKAAEKVAKSKGLDLIINEEACFYVSSNYNVSDAIVKELDTRFQEDLKATAKAEAAKK